ncbi:MAG: ATP-binding protein, partial [Chloroflexaceae bacterium]|nr:ATP-binding protein [Chloroflexaceae bacterium]
AIAIENTRLYQQIQQSEQRYRDLFANANDLIFMLDADLHITSMNKVGPQLTGYSLEELVKRPLALLCAPAVWAVTSVALQEAMSGRSMPPFEMEVLRKDGEPITLEVSAQPMSGDGVGNGLHCIARDLTERRRLEQQLVQSEKLSAIGQLVAGVAHELNNPLTSISGYAQLLLRDQELGTTLVQDVKHIHTQAERAAKIVQNLLLFAREHKPERVEVNINDVLRSTLALQAYQLRVDNISVVTNYAADLPRTVADPHQLQQVFLNLITNAHHAMRENGPSTLTITTRVGTPRRDQSDLDGTTHADIVEVAISDTGIGIPERDINRIFDPFFTTKPVGQGTGLGLSICFGIVREHGGIIWADSTVGAGTTVFVELPLRSLISLPNTLPNDGEPDVHDANASYQVLVVDDEEPVGALLARLLKDLGHQPILVSSGAAALDVVSRESFDLILSDIKMPGMSGFDLRNAIHQRDPELAQRIVFTTGDTISPATQARLAESGNLYLAKPFAIERLEAMIQHALRRRTVELGE